MQAFSMSLDTIGAAVEQAKEEPLAWNRLKIRHIEESFHPSVSFVINTLAGSDGNGLSMIMLSSPVCHYSFKDTTQICSRCTMPVLQ